MQNYTFLLGKKIFQEKNLPSFENLEGLNFIVTLSTFLYSCGNLNCGVFFQKSKSTPQHSAHWKQQHGY